eukprot:691050_1
MHAEQQWQCNACTYLNRGNADQCAMCHNPKQSMIKAAQWKCLFCDLVNEPNATTCLQCKKANIHLVNINQICFCGRKVIKYQKGWTQCYSCCKTIEKKEKTYYYCNSKQCVHKEVLG